MKSGSTRSRGPKVTRDAFGAVVHDEKLTRLRVDELEKWATQAGAIVEGHTGVLGRGFWGRLSWLVLGR